MKGELESKTGWGQDSEGNFTFLMNFFLILPSSLQSLTFLHFKIGITSKEWSLQFQLEERILI